MPPILGSARVPLADDDPDHAALLRFDGIVQGNTLGETAAGTQFIEFADDLPGIPSQFILIPFEFIEFFDDGHGDDNDVVLEGFQRLGAVKQNVGVQNENFLHET